MDIFQTFAINWYLVIAQIVNFLIIFYLLKRYVYKPVFSMLQKRADIIRKGIEDAKKSSNAFEEAEQERKSTIKKSRDDAKQILDAARKDADDIITTAQEKAKKQTDIMLQDAQSTIERETHLAEERLQKRIGVLIEKIIKQSLQDVLTPDEQKEIITKTLKHLPK